jgi:hypothetical protein
MAKDKDKKSKGSKRISKMISENENWTVRELQGGSPLDGGQGRVLR